MQATVQPMSHGMYVYLAGLVPVQVPQGQVSPIIEPAANLSSGTGQLTASGTVHKSGSKNTPSSSPAFVWDGWWYGPGLNRKERRAIMFTQQDKRQINSKKLQNRVWVGTHIPNGTELPSSPVVRPTPDEKVLPCSPLALPVSQLSWSPSTQGLTPTTDTPMTPLTLSPENTDLSAEYDFDLPPLMEEWSDEEL